MKARYLNISALTKIAKHVAGLHSLSDEYIVETIHSVDTIFDLGPRLLEQDPKENVTYSSDCVRIGFCKFVKWYYYLQKTQGFCKSDIYAIEGIFDKFEDEQFYKEDFIVQ